MSRSAMIALASVLLYHDPAAAQNKDSVEGPASLAAGPFQVVVYGAYRDLVQMQGYSAKVQLRTVMHSGATEAVGAVSGLRGEISAIDGKLLVSYGFPCSSCGRPGEDHAALLVAGRVTAWRPAVKLPADLMGKDLESFIIMQAKEAGLDLGKSFPIHMKGTLIKVVMHVLRAPNPGFKGHGSAHPMAEQENISAAQLEGEVVGFFAPASAQGVIGHPGDAFHSHWVDKGRTRTGHLDAFGMTKGSELVLPEW